MEQRKSSLTLVKDATPFTVVEKATDLTPQQVGDAFKHLVVDNYVKTFPMTERYSVDPVLEGQKYFVWSFVPSPGAKPDARGLFGMAKFRGAFEKIEDCENKSIQLIKNYDSYHEYLFGYVGRPFPVSASSKYVKEEKVIDVKHDQVRVIGDYVAEKREKEKQEHLDIKDREKELLESSTKETTPEEKYITLRVTKAHLTQSVEEARKKLAGMEKSLKQVYADIDKMDVEHPELKEGYLERYRSARAEVGIVEEKESVFLKYIGDDSRLDLNHVSLD